MQSQTEKNLDYLNHALRNNSQGIKQRLNKIEGHLKTMHEACDAFAASLENDQALNFPKVIILHHSLTPDGATVSWQAIRRYHLSLGWKDIGYHFGIEQVNTDYEILAGRPMLTPGAHTKGMNRTSLGICFVGNFDETPVPALQWRAGLKLVRSLMAIFHIPAQNVRGHRYYADKTCPGLKFDVNRFRNDLEVT